jgi:hypothetical protein
LSHSASLHGCFQHHITGSFQLSLMLNGLTCYLLAALLWTLFGEENKLKKKKKTF